MIARAPTDADVPRPPAENIESPAQSSPFGLQTDGLDDVDLGGSDTPEEIGIDEDGNLIDGEGNIIIPADELDTGDGADETEEPAEDDGGG